MKKMNFWLLAGLFVSAFAMTACGNDDEDDPTVPPTEPTSSSAITQANLAGEWGAGGLDINQGISFTFEGDQVTFKQNENVGYKGPYTIKDGVASFTITGNNNVSLTYQTVSSLVAGNTVLVVKQIVKNPDETRENLAFALVKKGMAINTKKEDLKGQWCWYEGDAGNKTITLSYKFEGDNLELIITPWSQKLVGTYTYVNGILKFHPTVGYRSQGNINPTTLEADWRVDNSVLQDYEGLLLTNGNEAYNFIIRNVVMQRKK